MTNPIVNHCKPLPSGAKLLIMGGGFTGQNFAKTARALGTEVLCTRRDINKNGADITFDSEKNECIPESVLEGTTHLLSCIPPGKDGEDPVLKTMGKKIQSIPLEWIGYLSTTGVYGDCKGEWVKESDAPNPQQKRSKRRLRCEQSWQELDLPVQILRLPGIYGPGRSAIESILKESTKMVDKPKQVFSRIHVDDIVAATVHLMHLAAKGIKPNVVNLADNVPCSNIDVLSFAAYLTKKPLPPIEKFEIAAKSMSPMALSFWQENRKVCNHLLCTKLGYNLIHPDYKSGLQDCLQKTTFKNEE